MIKNTVTIYDPSKLHPKGLINERGIELSLASSFINNHNNVIEVGATSPYYFSINHQVIDPYDDYATSIRLDAEKFNFTDYDVLCISTIEHMGVEGNYGESKMDDEKPIRFLDKIHKEAKSYLITFPVGANKKLDNYIKYHYDNYPCCLYLRTVFNPPIWLYQNSLDQSIFDLIEYDKPFPNGNAIVCINKE